MEFKNIKRLLKLPPEVIAIYEVEDEVLEWAKLHAQFYLARYAKNPARHWSENESRNVYVGLLGEKVFDLICLQFAVPTDRNDPVIDWRKRKAYDFYIPDFGAIEVKTFEARCRKVLVKTSEWHGNDFLVVFHLTANPTTLRMEGWLTRKQVEALPVSRRGEQFTRYASAYMTDMDKLNPANEFLRMLNQKSLQAKVSREK